MLDEIISLLADFAIQINRILKSEIDRDKILKIFNRSSFLRNIHQNLKIDEFSNSIDVNKSDKLQNLGEYDILTKLFSFLLFKSLFHYCNFNERNQKFKIKYYSDYLPEEYPLRNLFHSAPQVLDTIERISEFDRFEDRLNHSAQNLVKSNEKLTDNDSFYDQFLDIYDKRTAKNRGVIYTPKEIVYYMLSGIDYSLENYFNIQGGLSTSDKDAIDLLDPAAGTQNFAIGLLEYMQDKTHDLSNSPQEAIKSMISWIDDIFLPHMTTYELLPAPYIIGLMRIQSKIIELVGNNRDIGEKANFYERIYQKSNFRLENVLKKEHDQNYFYFNHHNTLSPPIQIILGNPPYNISTKNDSAWIRGLLEDYKKGLQEKNLKILSDDYVKFIRYAQWRINQNNLGMIAFITNNNYLDGVLFKKMRLSLMQNFNEIYVVNLHGNMRKGEAGNPFDIKVGVSIVFLLKTTNKIGNVENCNLKYFDIDDSTLKAKLKTLKEGFNPNSFSILQITPDYYFIPRDVDKELQYYKYPSIKDFFIENPKSGIMTGRDALVSNPDKALLTENVHLFFSEEFEKLDEKRVRIKKTKSWDPKLALRKSNFEKASSSIIRYNYRGLDKRFLVYDNALVEGCRLGYLDQINRDNPAIAVTRSIRAPEFNHALMIIHPAEKCFMAVKDSSYIFPLKLPDTLGNLKWNLTEKNIELKFTAGKKEIFYYIYAILFSNIYRERYKEQLRKHFPRIPLPLDSNEEKSKQLFNEMALLGKQLGDLHTGKSDLIDISKYKIEIGTDSRIITFNYVEKYNRVFLNKKTWINNIKKTVWNFKIGTKSQLEIWLKERKYIDPESEKKKPKKRHKGLRRGLSSSELEEFLKLISIIENTIEILPKIDEVYQKIDLS